MGLLIAAVGGVIAVFGAIGVVKPTTFTRVLEQVRFSPIKIYAGAAVRFMIGVMLFLGAPVTAAPNAIRFIGVLAMVGGASILIIGVNGARSLIDWFGGRPHTVRRTMFLAVAALGTFLMWAAITA